MKITKENILNYLQELKPEFEQLGIQKIALFGSYATGQSGAYSDIDIAIQKRKDFLEYHSAYDYFAILSQLKRKIVSKLHRPVDIFDLDSKSSFKESIEKELIYA